MLEIVKPTLAPAKDKTHECQVIATLLQGSLSVTIAVEGFTTAQLSGLAAIHPTRLLHHRGYLHTITPWITPDTLGSWKLSYHSSNEEAGI